MQIRLDAENAAAVKRESQAHIRIFKRRRSHADIVNMMVRDWVLTMKGRKSMRDEA